jgi:hypothetical protein
MPGESSRPNRGRRCSPNSLLRSLHGPPSCSSQIEAGDAIRDLHAAVLVTAVEGCGSVPGANSGMQQMDGRASASSLAAARHSRTH